MLTWACTARPVNVVKLQNAGAEKTQDSIETLVRAERRAGLDDEDASVSVAVLWNGRILRLCERLIRDVVKSDAPMPQLAHRAYKTTLEPHHNWIMRSGARALLRLTPDRRTLFETRLGYGADDPALTADLGAFAVAAARGKANAASTFSSFCGRGVAGAGPCLPTPRHEVPGWQESASCHAKISVQVLSEYSCEPSV